MVSFRICFCYSIIFIHIIFISACTEPSSTMRDSKTPSLSTGVSLQNVAGSWAEPTEVTRYIAARPGSGINRAKLHMTSQGGAFIALQTMQSGLIYKYDTSIAYRAPGSSIWQYDRPFENLPLNFNGYPEIYTSKSSNYVFATLGSSDAQINKNYISRFDPSEGWSTPVSIGDVWQPSVVTGASGNASIIWVTHADNGTAELHARLFEATDGLSLMSTLVRGKSSVPGTFFINKPAAYMDAQGITQVFWYENEFTLNNGPDVTVQASLWHSKYDVVNGWAIPEKIEEGTLLGETPMVQMQVAQEAETGNILILLRSYSLGGEQVITLHYREDSWIKTTVIDPSTGGDIIGSNISLNDKGEVVLVWAEIAQFLAMRITIWSQRFNFVNGWAAAEMIAEKRPPPSLQGYGYGSDDAPQVDINNNGHIIVLWKDIFSATEDYYATLYTPESDWGESQLVAIPQELKSIGFSPMFNVRLMTAINDNNQSSVSWVNVVRNSQNITYQVMMRDHIPGASVATLTRQSIANKNPVSTVALLDNRNQNKSLLTPRIAVSGADNQRPLRLAGQRLLSAWDSPTEIDRVILPMDESSYFMGPRLWANNQQAAFVYWSGGSQVMDEAGNPLSNAAIFRRESKDGSWLSSMPLTQPALANSVFNGIYLQENTGVAYAMWNGACEVLCDEIYVSRFEPGLGWDAPTLIGNAPCCAQLFLDVDGNATVLWRGQVLAAAPDPSFPASPLTQWVVRQYIHGSGWLPPVLSLTNEAAVNRIQSHEIKNNFMTANHFDDGRVFVLWNESSKNRDLIRFVAQFDPVTGWNDLGELPAMGFDFPFNDLGDPTIHINQQDNKVQLFSDSLVFPPSGGRGKSQLSAMQFDGKNWLGTQFNSNVTDTSGFIGYPPYVSDSTSAGEVVFVAQERLAMDATYPAVALHPYYYSPRQGWTIDTGAFITDPIPLTDTSVVGMPFVEPMEKLRISVNESGEAAIAWIDNSSLSRALYVSHYQPSSGWGIKELVTTIDGNSQYFGELDLHLDDNSQTSLVWGQVLVALNDVEHHIYSTVHHTDGAVVAPPLDDTPKPPAGSAGLAKSANWSESVVAYERVGRSGRFMNQNFMGPPRMTAITSDRVLLSTYVAINPDPARQQNADYEVSLKTLTMGGEWQEITPTQVTKPITSVIKSVSDQVNTIIYSAWMSQDELFVSMQSANQWSTPVSVATNVSEFFLLTNASGIVYVLWQDTLDSQTLNSAVVNSSAQENVQFDTPSSITVAQGHLTDTPVIDLQGNVWAIWYIDDVPGAKQGFLLTQYTKAVGWADPMALLPLNTMDSGLGLISTTENNVVLIGRDSQSDQLMATEFSLSTGWSAWQPLASQEAATSALMGLPRIVNNNTGDVMVLWVEEQKTSSGDIVHQVYTRQYLNVPASSARAWQSAMFVANISHPNMNESPDLFLADNASALVVWAQKIQWEGLVYVNKFSPETGWLQTPEIVAYETDPLSANDYFTPKGVIFPNGKVVVVWKYGTYEVEGVLSAVSQM